VSERTLRDAAEPGMVGVCTDCDGQMIETMVAINSDRGTVTLVCDNCGAEACVEYALSETNPWDEAEDVPGIRDVTVEPIAWVDCRECNGTGEVFDPLCDLRRAMYGREHPCHECDATGSVPRVVSEDETAVTDGGHGLTEKQQSLIDAGHAKVCDDCGEFVFNWNECPCQTGDGRQTTLTDGGLDVAALTIRDLQILAALVGDSRWILDVKRTIEGHVGHEIDGDALYRRASDLHDTGWINLGGTDNDGAEPTRAAITPGATKTLAEELTWLRIEASDGAECALDPDHCLAGAEPARQPGGEPATGEGGDGV
jgi:hypothetical protein